MQNEYFLLGQTGRTNQAFLSRRWSINSRDLFGHTGYFQPAFRGIHWSVPCARLSFWWTQAECLSSFCYAKTFLQFIFFASATSINSFCARRILKWIFAVQFCHTNLTQRCYLIFFVYFQFYVPQFTSKICQRNNLINQIESWKV